MYRQPSHRGTLTYAGKLLALATAYLVLGKLGLTLAPVNRFATLVWPPTGIALAALVLGGYRLWPAIAVGAFVTNLWTGAPPLVAFFIAMGNTAEAVVATFALRRLPGFNTSLRRFRDVVGLVGLAGMASTTLSATIGVASLLFSGFVAPDEVDRTWAAWWVGDLLGAIIVAPLLLTWAGPRGARPRPAALAEAAALGAVMVASATFVFSRRPEVVPGHPFFLPYVLFLPLIWAAVRFGVRGAATGVLFVAIAAIWGTHTGHGDFVRADRTESLFALHIFLVAAALTSLFLGSAVSELREKAAMLRGVIDGTPDAVYVKDRLGRYVIANTACARLLGVTPEKHPDTDDAAAFAADEARLLQERDQEVLRTGQATVFEETVTIAGQPRVFHSTKAPYQDRAGNVIGVIGISHDITEHKSEELARAWLASIVESCTDSVVGRTLDGTITSWNAAAERLFGYSCEQAVGQPITMIVPLEQRDELAGFYDRIRLRERIENQETVRCRRDGTKLAVALTLSPICDSAGSIVGISAISHDITARKRAEKELRESEARKRIEKEIRESEEQQRLAVEAAQLGVWSWDLRENRLVWTPRCKSLHGLGADDEMSHERLLAMLHPDDREKTEQAIRRSLAERSDHRVEYRVVWPDGSVHWLSAWGRVSCDEAGEPYRMGGVTLDITAQQRIDQERAELLERTQAATRAKDEFLAVLSHELRTPLQSMLGWTHLLRAPGVDALRVQKGLETIERNVKLQTQLIEDLLDVSRIVAGKLHLAHERVDLARVVASAIASATVAADAKSVHVTTAIEPLVGDVLGDPDRLQQVVSNLISNAVKFTPRGGNVRVRLEREGEEARIVVEDTGCGISAELLPYVFERFRQAESSTVRAHGGLGLGLAIVRHLVELHGGTVSAESPGKGRGARLSVSLPCIGGELRASAAERRRAVTNGPNAPVALGEVRVLVVDDDPDARELLDVTLHGAGADVHAVHSVRAALEAIASFRPHVLMSDIGMPDEDGYALIRQVRAREAVEGGHVPAVALSAFASQADREQSLALGFEAHLAKPASPGDIVRMVASLVGRPA